MSKRNRKSATVTQAPEPEVVAAPQVEVDPIEQEIESSPEEQEIEIEASPDPVEQEIEASPEQEEPEQESEEDEPVEDDKPIKRLKSAEGVIVITGKGKPFRPGRGLHHFFTLMKDGMTVREFEEVWNKNHRRDKQGSMMGLLKNFTDRGAITIRK